MMTLKVIADDLDRADHDGIHEHSQPSPVTGRARWPARYREATMTVTTSLGEHAATRSCSFAHASDQILCCIVNLINAINGENYAIAWLMACDLGRAIVHAESLTLQMTPGAARRSATTRLDSVRAVATSALAYAPRPSPLAIAQARSTAGGVDRSAWISEEQQWLAARRTTGPLSITTHGDNLILRSIHT